MAAPILLLCLLGYGIAWYRRLGRGVPASRAERGDPPERLLRWAAGLLSARRAEWGQAMLGELDHIEGRARRWRFAAGCAGAALVLPPWGPAAAAAWAAVTAAAAGGGLDAWVSVRYGLLDGGGVVFTAVLLAFLVSLTLAAAVLLRRPRVALPGLLGGLLVFLAWAAKAGFSFSGTISPLTSPVARPLLLLAVPALAGVAGTLLGGSAAAGRRAVRLAAVSAGLGLYLYGTLAVAVLGAGGPAGDPGATAAGTVSDRLGTNLIDFLVLLPLVTASVGWAAAAATARLLPRPAAALTAGASLLIEPGLASGPGLVTAPSPAADPARASASGGGLAPRQGVRAPSWRQVIFLAAVVAAVLALAAAHWLGG